MSLKLKSFGKFLEQSSVLSLFHHMHVMDIIENDFLKSEIVKP